MPIKAIGPKLGCKPESTHEGEYEKRAKILLMDLWHGGVLTFQCEGGCAAEKKVRAVSWKCVYLIMAVFWQVDFGGIVGSGFL